MADEPRYPNVARAIQETPWAILPGTLQTIIEIVGFRIAGGKLDEAEIQARVGGRQARRDVMMAGPVAVLPIYGVIIPRATVFTEMSGGTSVQALSSAFREVMADDNVSAVVFDIESPGGSTDLITEFASEIRAARGGKPIVAVANTRAASAAYHLASQADEIVVTPSGDVGSIGVFAAHDDISKAQQMEGIKTSLIFAGKHKVEGNPFEPLSDEARAAIQARVDEMYATFVADVAKGRRVSVDTVRAGFGQGRMVSAKAAVEQGMADSVGTLEATIQRLSRRRAHAPVHDPPPEPDVTVDARALNAYMFANLSFPDAVDQAHRALDAVVSGAESLRALTATKREQLAHLDERIQALLADTEAESASPDADDSLELESQWLELAHH